MKDSLLRIKFVLRYYLSTKTNQNRIFRFWFLFFAGQVVVDPVIFNGFGAAILIWSIAITFDAAVFVVRQNSPFVRLLYYFYYKIQLQQSSEIYHSSYF